MLVFVVIPALLVYHGFSRLEHLQIVNSRQILEQKIEHELAELVKNSNTERFLVRSLWNAFYQEKTRASERIGKVKKEFDEEIDFLLFRNDGKILEATVNPDSFNGSWPKVMDAFNRMFDRRGDDFKLTAEEEVNFKRMFGPQILPETLKDCISQDNQILVWPDVARIFPTMWFARNKYETIFVFIRPSLLDRIAGLEKHVKFFKSNEIGIGFIEGERIYSSAPIVDEKQIQKNLLSDYRVDKPSFNAGSEVFFQRMIHQRLRVFAFFSKNILRNRVNVDPKVALSLLLILLLPVILLSFRAIVLKVNLRISLVHKLGLLFVFSAGLPLMMLFFVGYDYLNQKQFALFDEIHDKATRYMQNFDERYESEFAYRIVIAQQALKDYIPVLSKDGIVPFSYFPFAVRVCNDIQTLSDVQIYLIASSSNMVGTEKLISRGNQIFRLPGTREKKSDKEEVKIYSRIGKFIVDTVNGVQADEKVSTEVELLSESVMQKNIYELQQEFVAADGKIQMFGLGARNSPTYIDLISVSENSRQDYLLLVLWGKNRLETFYLNRQFLNANRNINNLKIFAVSEEGGRFFPPEVAQNRPLRDYVAQFSQKPHPPRQFIEVDHKKYLIMGFRGKFLRDFCLFALYPAEEVEKEIYGHKKLLVSACFGAVIILSLLGWLLVNSFIRPLRVIAEGAQAIQQRDFDMRLPDLGYDEFGDIARVFNNTMVDFEELKVAGIIQEQLLPRAAFDNEQLSIAGKSMIKGDVGGDYFDYLSGSDNGSGLMIGDVSGQGLGAALIMAMAKAAVLQSLEILDQPKQMLVRLHEMMKSTRFHGEKRYMSLQYIWFNGQTGEGIYANAGGFPPLKIDPLAATVEEIPCAGPFLGALSRPRFMEQQFVLEPGQALVLYTDGMIEAQNFNGKELGFEHFRKIVIEAYDKDPEVYCRNVFSACMAFKAGNEKPEDDMTILVLVRKA